MPQCRAKAVTTQKRCRFQAMKGKKVCWRHGGKSTGPKTAEGKAKVSQNALKHGIYANTVFEDEKELAKDLATGSLEQELMILRLQLRRALIAQKEVENSIRENDGEDDPDNPTGFKLAEVTEENEDGTSKEFGSSQKEKTKVVRKRPDFDTVIYRLTGRIGELERIHKELTGGFDPNVNWEQIGREVAEALDKIDRTP